MMLPKNNDGRLFGKKGSPLGTHVDTAFLVMRKVDGLAGRL